MPRRTPNATLVFGLVLLALLVLAACADRAGVPSISPTPTATPVPAATQTRTWTPQPSPSPTPTRTRTLQPSPSPTPPLTATAIGSSSPAASDHNDRIDSVPDVMQMDPAGDLPFGGSYSCAPVSAANYLVWLADNGYPDLAQPDDSVKQRVLDLARELGLPEYMNAQGGGVSPRSYASGIRAYIDDHTHYNSQIDFWGWEHDSRDAPPELSWFTDGLDKQGAVWLLVASCQESEAADEHICTKLHWVTLVGSGVDAAGQADPSYLIIHCSAPQSGTELHNEYVRTEELREGTLRFTDAGIETAAVGFYHMVEGMMWPEAGEMPVIAGAVRLRLEDSAQ
jgi:hypothetical protein